MIPFTTEQFLKIFESYNQAIYPVQWILLMLAMAAVFLAIRPSSRSSRTIAALLAVLWFWTGVAYHLVFFSRINDAAYLFALLCIIEVVILLFVGVIRSDLHFHARLNVAGFVGSLLIFYALFIYPALGYLFGHVYPLSPTSGRHAQRQSSPLVYCSGQIVCRSM